MSSRMQAGLLPGISTGWVLALCFFGGIVAKAQQTPERQFDVLWVPGPELRRPLPQMTPQTVSASLGGKRYRVVGVQGRERAASTPLVVGLDFDNTNPGNHACLLEAIWPILTGTSTVRATLLAMGNSPGVVYFHSLRQGEVAYARNALPGTLSAACEEGRKGGGQDAFRYLYAGIALPSIARAFPAEQGPVRVVWLADKFDWASNRWTRGCPYSGCPDRETVPANSDPLYQAYEHVAETGMTVFPVVLPELTSDYTRRKTRAIPNAPLEDARRLAEFTGGFAVAAGAGADGILESVIRDSEKGVVVRLAGPVMTRRGRTSDLPQLRLAAKAEGAGMEFHRPWLVNAPGTVRPDPAGFRAARMVGVAADLEIEAGCGGHRPNLARPEVSFRIPSDVSAGTAARRIHVELQALPLDPARRSIQRVLSSKDGHYCVALGARMTGGSRFRLIAEDLTTGWVATTDGTLVAAH